MAIPARTNTRALVVPEQFKKGAHYDIEIDKDSGDNVKLFRGKEIKLKNRK